MRNLLLDILSSFWNFLGRLRLIPMDFGIAVDQKIFHARHRTLSAVRNADDTSIKGVRAVDGGQAKLR